MAKEVAELAGWINRHKASPGIPGEADALQVCSDLLTGTGESYSQGLRRCSHLHRSPGTEQAEAGNPGQNPR